MSPISRAWARVLPVAVAIPLIIAGGCGGAPGANLVGVWEGRTKVVAPPGSDPAAVDEAERIRLEIRGDGTFTLTQLGIPREGEVFFDFSGARLKIERYMDRPLASLTPEEREKQQDILVKLRGKALEVTDPGGITATSYVVRRTGAQ